MRVALRVALGLAAVLLVGSAACTLEVNLFKLDGTKPGENDPNLFKADALEPAYLAELAERLQGASADDERAETP